VKLADYCLGEDGFVLVPIEHLGAAGLSTDAASLLVERAGWQPARVELLSAGLALYLDRSSRIARRTRLWPGPRLRNLGIVEDPFRFHPYARVLNTSTWTLYREDLDPGTSHAELVAYVLALTDWMEITGEATEAPVRSAAWWLAATERDCRSYREAAARAARPGGGLLQAVGESLGWLRKLRHRDLAPPQKNRSYREIPGTGLLVPSSLESSPPELIAACRTHAVAAVDAYRRRWKRTDAAAVGELRAWLAEERPPLVITDRSGECLWTPADGERASAVEAALCEADAAAVEEVRADLDTIADRTRAFFAALVDADALPSVRVSELVETGYTYLHPHHRLLAYNLHEPGIERTVGRQPPYARAMLGARALHEWSHVADAAGWIGQSIDDGEMESRRKLLEVELEAVVGECASEAHDELASDLAGLVRGRSVGAALADVLLARLPDYRANLLARLLMTEAERETYARHNVRALRSEYSSSQAWRKLLRYLFEVQYLLPALGLTTLEDPVGYFFDTTGFPAEFFGRGILSRQQFDSLVRAVARVCAGYAVDAARVRPPVR